MSDIDYKKRCEGVKFCKKCGVEKKNSDFYYLPCKNRYMTKCKSCYSVDRKQVTRRYFEKNRTKINQRERDKRLSDPEYREKMNKKSSDRHFKFKDEYNLKKRVYYATLDKNVELEKRRKWYQNNKERHSISRSKYYEENKERLKAARRKWENNRLKTDPSFRLRKKLSSRIRDEIKGVLKESKKTEALIGCSISELMAYIESKFQDGMNWSNWSLRGWHLDHKIPVSWFDLTNESCIKKAFHYTNLQPLWARDNLQKKNFYCHV